ncbi:hypothetical protein ACQPUQ_14090 [Clostridium paraputrificum]|uniref:hypothetical protein n=1 Tax=Clostridium paraputrificum TaxID=29363 RepID=UPI0026EE32FA|nr:hypothetical protein [Clostridium paraputrificum]
MDFLVNPSELVSSKDCCFFGAKCECQVGKVCVQCGTLCAANCSELCGGQFCTPVRADPMSNS